MAIVQCLKGSILPIFLYLMSQLQMAIDATTLLKEKFNSCLTLETSLWHFFGRHRKESSLRNFPTQLEFGKVDWQELGDRLSN